MAVELVTGHSGTPHVSSADVGSFNAGVVGPGRYVLATGQGLAATMTDANTLVVGTGDAVFDGRHVRLEATEAVTIESGGQGQLRNDIVGIAYANDGGVESASLEVVRGTPSSSAATDPDLPTGSILEGASEAFMPLWRVPLDGLVPGTPQRLFDSATPLWLAGRELLALDDVGTPGAYVDGGSVTVQKDTNTKVATVALPKGRWLVLCGVMFSASATGRRVVGIGPSTGASAAVGRNATVVAQGVNASQYLQVARQVELSEDTSYSAIVYQNSGGSLTCSAIINAVKIGPS